MRYWGKRVFRLLRVSRAGLFSDLSVGDTCPLRIPVTQLLIKYAYQGAWMSGNPKNPLAPIPLPVLPLYCIQIRQKLLRKVSFLISPCFFAQQKLYLKTPLSERVGECKIQRN
ncbi:MAG: hypothetical protein DRG39_08690 [Deltaproteobacteria bacterium]|nr:MAG: hypothetical protein DRG39_08690 [Deltaproteobacteria bacterium]